MDVTLKHCADKAKINISTARFYKDKYLQYFTTSGEGRNTKYDEESTVEILSLISKLYKQNMDEAQIVEALDNLYGIPTSSDLVVQELPQLDIIEGIREMLSSELAKRDEAIDKLSQQVSELAQGSEERDRMLMENIRLLQQQNGKSWWQRVWGK